MRRFGLWGVLALAAATAVAAPLKTALYVDDGCRGGGLLCWATILRDSPDVDLKLVSGADIRSGALDDRALLVMPGGTGREQYAALGDAGAQKIRDFVAAGGSYFGTCCGIAIALNEETSYSKRLRMLPLKRVDGPVRGGFTANVSFNRRGAEWLGIREGDWKIRYHNGPIVEPAEPVPFGSDFEVLATMNCELMQVGAAKTPMFGTPAAVRAKYGKGQMFALNCHPEAMPKTREIVVAGIRALTGTTIRLKPMKSRTRGAESVGFFASELGSKSSVEEYFKLYDDPAVDVTPVTRDMLETDSALHFDRIVRPGTPKAPQAN